MIDPLFVALAYERPRAVGLGWSALPDAPVVPERPRAPVTAWRLTTAQMLRAVAARLDRRPALPEPMPC